MERTSPQPTLAEIARLAGTSPSTVSRVLSGRSATIRVSERTKRRILEVTRALQYRPNIPARTLASGKANGIGIYLKHPERLGNPNITELLIGIGAVTQSLGYSVSWYFDEKGTPPPTLFLDGRVDGALILEDDFLSNEEMESLHSYRLPVVFVGRYEEGQARFVCADDSGGMMQAVRHLVERGHRRICHLSAGDLRAGVERREGFLKAVEACGVEGLVVESGWKSAQAESHALRLVQSSEAPTAFVCVNDLAAMAVVRGLARIGKRVPGDVAVVGFNDSYFARYGNPPLTSVRRPLREMGQAAARLLASLIAGEKTASNVVLPTELVVRESTGGP